MLVRIVMMIINLHIPTSHITTKWESVIMRKGGKMIPTIPIKNYKKKFGVKAGGGWGWGVGLNERNLSDTL